MPKANGIAIPMKAIAPAFLAWVASNFGSTSKLQKNRDVRKEVTIKRVKKRISNDFTINATKESWMMVEWFLTKFHADDKQV